MKLSKGAKTVLRIGLLGVALLVLYHITSRYPNLIHKKHEYKGYTYYSSIFNTDFNEYDAEYSFDSILGNEPDYIYILDSFYEDGYRIYFDDKFTYSYCTRDFITSDKFSACVTFNAFSGDVQNGMFVNYENDFFVDKIFFHELSHYADHKLGDVSKSEEFKAIFKEEYGSSTLAKDDYYKDVVEYFAEESAYFINEDSGHGPVAPIRPYGTHEDAPKTFDFIKEKLAELKKMNAHQK